MAKPPKTQLTTIYRNSAGVKRAATDVAGIIADYRQIAATTEADPDATAHVNDDDAWTIISGIPGNGDDVDMARAEALVKADPSETDDDAKEPVVHGMDEIPVMDSVVVAASDQPESLTTVAKALDSSPEVNGELELLCSSKEKLDLGGVVLAEMIVGTIDSPEYPVDKAYRPSMRKPLAAFGKTQAEAINMVNGMPEAGTTFKRDDDKLVWSNNPERYRQSYNKDGKRLSKTASYFRELATTLKMGAGYATDLEYYRSDAGKQGNKKLRLKSISRLSGRINTIANNLRKMRRFVSQWQAVLGIPESKIKVYLNRELDDSGNVTATLANMKDMICVYDANRPADAENVSLTTFLSWKPKLCKKGATVEQLKATASRTAKNSQNTGKVKTAMAIVDADLTAASLAYNFENEAWTAKLEKHLGLPENGGSCESWNTVFIELNYMFNPTGGRLLEALEKAQAKAKAAKAAKDAADKDALNANTTAVNAALKKAS